MLLQGVHPKVVQERLGHSKMSTTMDIYSHAVPSMQEETVKRLRWLWKWGAEDQFPRRLMLSLAEKAPWFASKGSGGRISSAPPFITFPHHNVEAFFEVSITTPVTWGRGSCGGLSFVRHRFPLLSKRIEPTIGDQADPSELSAHQNGLEENVEEIASAVQEIQDCLRELGRRLEAAEQGRRISYR